MQIKSKTWLEKNGELVFGEGKSELLKAIDQTGSISKASKKMGISFRHAWGYITAIERRLGLKLIERRKGGRQGGGSCLTPHARSLLQKYDRLNRIINAFVDKKYKEIFGDRYKNSKSR